jgi:hypothetical protein
MIKYTKHINLTKLQASKCNNVCNFMKLLYFTSPEPGVNKLNCMLGSHKLFYDISMYFFLHFDKF